MSDSIIIYRNPMEKALWEALMSSNVLVYLFIIGVGFAIGVLCHMILMAYIPRNKRFRLRTLIQWTSTVVCFGVWGYMFHQIGLF